MLKLEEEELLCRFAYQSWLDRGRPLDSTEIDWHHALRMLQAHCARSIQTLDAAMSEASPSHQLSR